MLQAHNSHKISTTGGINACPKSLGYRGCGSGWVDTHIACTILSCHLKSMGNPQTSEDGDRGVPPLGDDDIYVNVANH